MNAEIHPAVPPPTTTKCFIDTPGEVSDAPYRDQPAQNTEVGAIAPTSCVTLAHFPLAEAEQLVTGAAPSSLWSKMLRPRASSAQRRLSAVDEHHAIVGLIGIVAGIDWRGIFAKAGDRGDRRRIDAMLEQRQSNGRRAPERKAAVEFGGSLTVREADKFEGDGRCGQSAGHRVDLRELLVTDARAARTEIDPLGELRRAGRLADR